jgi:periplasmic protein CpxP/Spy
MEQERLEGTPMTKTLKLIAGTAVGFTLGLILVVGAGVALTAAQGQEPDGPGKFMGQRGPGGPGGGRRGPGGPGGIIQGLRALDLTEAQREQVKATMAAHQAEMAAQFSRARTARTALHGAVTAGTFDEAAVRQAAAEVASVEADGSVLDAKVYAEVWALLTPEQQQKAKALQAQREERRRQR